MLYVTKPCCALSDKDIIIQRTAINHLMASINIYCIILFIHYYIVPLFNRSLKYREFNRLVTKRWKILRRDSDFSDRLDSIRIRLEAFWIKKSDCKRRVLSFKINLLEKKASLGNKRKSREYEIIKRWSELKCWRAVQSIMYLRIKFIRGLLNDCLCI